MPDEIEIEEPDEDPQDEPTSRAMTPTTWGGVVLDSKDSPEEEPDPRFQPTRFGLTAVQRSYLLIMLVTGISFAIALGLILILLKLAT